MSSKPQLNDQHLDATEKALNHVTDKSKGETNPKEHLHIPGDHEKAHSLFRAVFPYNSLREFESSWHLGNYVIDRKTGQKSFEPMSIYVRLGMHLLYYGSEQENLLQSKRAQELLKEQSVKMGKQYDSPESKDHIQPFIESFHLQDSLSEMVSNLLSRGSGCKYCSLPTLLLPPALTSLTGSARSFQIQHLQRILCTRDQGVCTAHSRAEQRYCREQCC